MNKRQAKKRRKYEHLKKVIYWEAYIMPKNWSEIRWAKQWLKRKKTKRIKDQIKYFTDLVLNYFGITQAILDLLS